MKIALAILLLLIIDCKDKPIKVITGTVEYINPGSIDEPYIIVNGIECDFKEFNHDFKKGDTVTISGQDYGKYMRECVAK